MPTAYKKIPHIMLLIMICFVSVLVVKHAHYKVQAEGTYAVLNTANSLDGSADAINYSQGGVWTIDKFGKYIWLVQERALSETSWTWSNDNGATWEQGSQNYGFFTRGSVAYDSKNDRLHVIWEASSNDDGIIYRAYSIQRDGSNNITDIIRDVNANVGYDINLQLQTSSTREVSPPIALWIDDGSTNGILVAVWQINGGGLADTRASMRRLSYTSADGVAGNWEALDGTADVISTDAPTVDSDVIFHSTEGTVGSSAGIRGGSGSFADDLYVFVAHSTDSNTDDIVAYRASWSEGDSNWSGGWQAPVTIGAMDTGSGYSLKEELVTKPVLDTVNDRLYVGWARWKDGTNGDTVSIAYLDSTNNPSSVVDIYSALGTHSYAPTLDIAYDNQTDWLYTAYVLSTTNGDNGSIQYKTYDGATLSSATTFYTTPGGTGGENGSADIPILYRNRSSNNRLLFAFRVNGALPPTAEEPHEVYWGYETLATQPQVQFTNTSGSGSESTTSVNIPISLSTSFVRDVEVSYAVSGGTATGSGTDYTLASGTATVTAGDTSENISLTVVNDTAVESNETIEITLSSPEFATLGSNTTFTYTIVNDDTLPSPGSEDKTVRDRNQNVCKESKPKEKPLITGYTATASSITFYFSDKSQNVNRYSLEYGTNNNILANNSNYIGEKGTSQYTITNLKPFTTYYIRVKGHNTCKAGEWSNLLQAITLNTATTNISSLNTATQVTQKLVTPTNLKPRETQKEEGVKEQKETDTNIMQDTEINQGQQEQDEETTTEDAATANPIKILLYTIGGLFLLGTGAKFIFFRVK